MRSIPDKFFDLCIADPPYGIGISGQKECFCKNPKHNRKFHTEKGWDKTIPSKSVFTEMHRVSKNLIIWGANYFLEYLNEAHKGWICWYKGQQGLTMSDCELAYSNFDTPTRVITINRCVLAKEGTIHPTQKPIALYSWLLDNYAKGGKIFDPFLGSGSSRIAAYKKGYDFYACERDKEYYDAQEERFRRECLGEVTSPSGIVITQQQLF
jgi:site-specific DNA-methyltransferase (adenine-specific)